MPVIFQVSSIESTLEISNTLDICIDVLIMKPFACLFSNSAEFFIVVSEGENLTV